MNPFGISPLTQKNTNDKATKWQFQLKAPERLQILYIFNQYNFVKGSFNITVAIGALPEFHLGVINNSNPALQSEPNFPIQRGTKCFVSIEQQMNK